MITNDHLPFRSIKTLRRIRRTGEKKNRKHGHGCCTIDDMDDSKLRRHPKTRMATRKRRGRNVFSVAPPWLCSQRIVVVLLIVLGFAFQGGSCNSNSVFWQRHQNNGGAVLRSQWNRVTGSTRQQQQQEEHHQEQHGRRRQEDVNPAQDCYDNLFTSDVNGDGRVDADEYVTFVQLEGPDGFLQDATTFVDLPLTLQSNFFTLACLCDSSRDCCFGNNAHLATDGTAPGATPTPEQSSYLNLVCSFTGRAIDKTVEESIVPTLEPTAMPSATETTVTPTSSPSVAPSVVEVPPTQAPSSSTTTTTSPSSMAPAATEAPSSLDNAPTLMPTSLATTATPTITPTSPETTAAPTPTATGTAAPSPPLGFEDCFDNLYASDVNGDNKVDANEYVTFVQLEGPEGFVENATTLEDLPLRMQTNFYDLACFCNTSPDCCVGNNAHIAINGTGPDESPTMEELLYLNIVCSFTATAIQETLTPVPIIVKTSYSIVVVDGVTNNISESVYEAELVAAMDVLSQQVADDVNNINMTTTTTTTPPPPISPSADSRSGQRVLRFPLSGAHSRRVHDDNHHSQRLRIRQVPNNPHRKLEVAVDLPTAIDQNVNVGFTDDPELLNGVFVTGPCPFDLAVDDATMGSTRNVDPSKDLCQEVTASISLQLTEGEDPIDFFQLYHSTLERLILMGDLGVILDSVAPSSVASVASGEESSGGPLPTAAPTTGPDEDSGPTGLPAGAIAGIAVGGLALVLAIGYFAKDGGDNVDGNKGGDGTDKFQDDEMQPVPLDEKLEMDKGGDQGDKKMIGEATTVASTAVSVDDANNKDGQSNLGQQQTVDDDLVMPPIEDDSPNLLVVPVAYIGGSKQDDNQQLSSEIEALSPTHPDDGLDSSSQASGNERSTGGISHESEAGWSETYTSSMGTMSDDEMLPDTPGQDMVSNKDLVALGTTGGALLSVGCGGTPDDEPATDSKYEDLEQAIMAGDWTAVGATAAVLATMQYDSQSRSEISKSTASGVSSLRSDKWKDAMDEKKAAELDQLIEQGDWEGIIQAAAKYEAAESGTGDASNVMDEVVVQKEDTVLDDDIMVHEDNSDDSGAEDVYSPSKREAGSSNIGEIGSTPKRDPEELRREVMDLVKRVVPEEVDHVDEMLEQFKGREGDLLETLMTMQQRATALESNKDSGSFWKS